jgi:hypothetical protein
LEKTLEKYLYYNYFLNWVLKGVNMNHYVQEDDEGDYFEPDFDDFEDEDEDRD